jgi:hypothetical protein
MPEPTPEALEYLRRTHAAGCLTLEQGNFDPESIETAVEVERHRWYWKPKSPKLVLVAESHVLTTERDMRFKMDGTAIKPFLRPRASLPPDRFVRLVYCLAYGESQLLSPQSPQGRNPGTPTYWDIFGRVAFRCPQPRREDGAEFDDRMRWKVDTLRELYRMGIWLLDASVHAVYQGNGNRLPSEIQNALHQQWWKGYGRHVVGFCDGAKIWVIGKTVFNCLSSLPGWRCRGWVYQPNASNVDLNHNWPKLLEDCWSL